MNDSRLETWARVLVDYSVKVQAGQTVAISGGVAAEPLLAALYRLVLERGAFPTMLPTLPGLATMLLGSGSDEQLSYISPIERFIREQADVTITVLAETNTKAMSEIDPPRQVLFQKARTELIDTFMRREVEGTVNWTLTLYPTDAYAQDADMATADFAEFVLKAGKLDAPDPIAAWQAQGAEQQRLIDWLAGKREVRLRGRDTDLTLSVEGRTWVNACGIRNFPDGEIFTGPVEDSVDGHVRFSFPAVTAGREVEDVRLRFHGGRVVDASAARNEDYLHRMLDTDAGARVLGEFAIGTNFGIERFTKNILFDDEDRRHGAHGARRWDPGSRQHQSLGDSLGSDLRFTRGRFGRYRRRAIPAGWADRGLDRPWIQGSAESVPRSFGGGW